MLLIAICSDKTGTLTQNKMTVVRGLLAESAFSTADDAAKLMSLPAAVRTAIVDGLALNSSAYEGKDDRGQTVCAPRNHPCAQGWWASGRADGRVTGAAWAGTGRHAIGDGCLQTFVGSKTEQALLNFTKLLKGDYMAIRTVRWACTRRALAVAVRRPLTCGCACGRGRGRSSVVSGGQSGAPLPVQLGAQAHVHRRASS